MKTRTVISSITVVLAMLANGWMKAAKSASLENDVPRRAFQSEVYSKFVAVLPHPGCLVT